VARERVPTSFESASRGWRRGESTVRLVWAVALAAAGEQGRGARACDPVRARIACSARARPDHPPHRSGDELPSSACPDHVRTLALDARVGGSGSRLSGGSATARRTGRRGSPGRRRRTSQRWLAVASRPELRDALGQRQDPAPPTSRRACRNSRSPSGRCRRRGMTVALRRRADGSTRVPPASSVHAPAATVATRPPSGASGPSGVDAAEQVQVIVPALHRRRGRADRPGDRGAHGPRGRATGS
jgi:hypothetical protein